MSADNDWKARIGEEDKFAQVRDWLRFHGDYDVQLNLWALYGTYQITVVHLGRTVWSDNGVNLGKRLDKAMDYLRSTECDVVPG